MEPAEVDYSTPELTEKLPEDDQKGEKGWIAGKNDPTIGGGGVEKEQ
jgi:hypothetical protein